MSTPNTSSASPVVGPGIDRRKIESAQRRHLAQMRRRLWDKAAGQTVRLGDYRVRVTDGPNAYMQYKDVFVRGIYRFACDRPDPLIIDGGSNMGISVLGFKHDHPAARVIAFEPDPAICRLLRENLERNGAAEGVRIVEAGLAAAEGAVASFAPDGSAGGQVGGAGATASVKVVPLSDYLDEPVDFLKLNIEGQELPVLQEARRSGRLLNVKRMVVEYHGWAGGQQCLGDLLNLLNDAGYRYLVHDFDNETGPLSKPPFKYRERGDWFCLVHAQRP